MSLPAVDNQSRSASAMADEEAALEMNRMRRASATTAAFTNHQGMDEFKRCKNEWISRLEGTNTDFEEAFGEQAQEHMFSKFTLSSFVEGTMAVLKNNGTAARIEASQTPPPLKSKKQLAVRHRPHSIEPMPVARSKAMQSHLATLPALNVNFSGSGKMNTSLTRMTKRPNLPKPKELTVVTGKVDYNQLRAEQKVLNNETAAADVKYKKMIADFDAMQYTIQRRFSLLLDPNTKMLAALPESQEKKMLVNIPDNVWTKVGSGPAGEVAYEL